MGKKFVLVVGGAGYIGSIVNKMLHQRGYETLILDNLSTGHREAVVAGKLFIGDYGNSQDLRPIFQHYPIDAVMHFGALTSVGESVQAPATYYGNNVCKTVTLLEEMVAHRVENLVFSSSAAVYGWPHADVIDEEHPKEPINPYGRTKLMVEQILADFEKPYGLRSISLRYFNAAGGDPDGQVLDYRTQPSNLIPVAMRSLLPPQRAISIFGTDWSTPDGTCIRDYIHVWDLAEAHLAALDHLFAGSKSTAYNLGNGLGFSVREILDSIERVTGRQLERKEVGRRAGDPERLVADSHRARVELGWKPQYANLDAIMAHSWTAISTTQGIAVR